MRQRRKMVCATAAMLSRASRGFDRQMLSSGRGSRLYSAAAEAKRPRSLQAQGLFSPLQRENSELPCVAVYDMTRRGPVAYGEAMELQSRLLASRVSNETLVDGLIIAEHEAVYTLGRGATEEHVCYDPSEQGAPPLVRTERGGDVTYHGPGQLVAYPVLQLASYKRDSHWYLRALEEVVIRTCKSLGIPDAERHDDHTGVWLRGHKIAATGVALRKWVTYHGIALNVSPTMSDFNRIVPCGLHDEQVGCLKDIDGFHDIDLRKDVLPRFLTEFQDVFQADLTTDKATAHHHTQ